jgi:hypothetical protein
MKIGDRVKVVNANSSFCGETGSVVLAERTKVDVHLDGRDDELMFYVEEVELI